MKLKNKIPVCRIKFYLWSERLPGKYKFSLAFANRYLKAININQTMQI